ncbi:transcriptional activator [Moellerella wisconsensis ATCC 35017]|uniref:Transcription antitermination protein RfaH n=2 Tax=Moellerella wisconsensis TaxID=158849 RepID=A0A0N1KIM2_9GAMM|nr:transcriptional activator [Moellerella wisconsensis ATCC 35017]VFS50674.1 Transcriptional activator rfaH [Moellerella wisconsensis]
MMEKWYLLYCKRGQIDRAIEHLTRQFVDCMTPMVEIEKVVRGKRAKVIEALFPNYLFVKFDHEKIHTTTIQSTRGVSHFVRFGQYPTVVPDKLIETFALAMSQSLTEPSTPIDGDKVVILEGIFAGIEAIYKEPDGEKRSILFLNILNQNVPKSLDNRLFKKLDN